MGYVWGQMGGEAQNSRERWEILVSVSENEADLVRKLRDEEAEKVAGALVAPVEVLQHADRGPERAQHLEHRPKETMPVRHRAEGLNRRWKMLGQFGYERPQGPDDGTGSRENATRCAPPSASITAPNGSGPRSG